jgi:peptidoglycan-associated lipoprotein
VDEVIAYMKQYPNDKVTIERHCCNIGTEEYKHGIGSASSDAVKKIMVDNGIDAARTTTISYGESRPACLMIPHQIVN